MPQARPTPVALREHAICRQEVLALTPFTDFLGCVGEGDGGTAALAGLVTSEPFALFHRWSDRTEPWAPG